jgi:hypothetical protein
MIQILVTSSVAGLFTVGGFFAILALVGLI